MMERPCCLQAGGGVVVSGSPVISVVPVWIWKCPHFGVVWSSRYPLVVPCNLFKLEVFIRWWIVLDQSLVNDIVTFFWLVRVLCQDLSRSYMSQQICPHYRWGQNERWCGGLGWGSSLWLCKHCMWWCCGTSLKKSCLSYLLLYPQEFGTELMTWWRHHPSDEKSTYKITRVTRYVCPVSPHIQVRVGRWVSWIVYPGRRWEYGRSGILHSKINL